MQRTPKNGRKLKLSGNNGVKINQKLKRDVSSTPKPSHGLDSLPCFGETSPCHDAWEPSPIRFMSTQDGSHGENDVIWNYYSPKSDKEPQSLNTPVRRKRSKRQVNEFSPIARLSSKRKLIKPQLTKTNYLQGLKEELLAINKDIQVKISTKKNEENVITSNNVNCSSSVGIDSDDMFEEPLNESGILSERSPYQNSKDVLKKPLRNNICDKIRKCENEGIIESDDSMNECLLIASQMVEENIKTDNIKINQLMPFPKNENTILIETPKISNDSFDNLISNMNEFDIDMLSSQASTVKIIPKNKLFTPQSSSSNLKDSLKNSRNYNRCITPINKVKDRLFVDNVNCSSESGTSLKENNSGCSMNDFSDLTNFLNSSALNESKLKFGRHNSMPESPRESKNKTVKGNSPSGFIRHKTMPTSNQPLHNSGESSPPMRCTQDEIMKKRQAAKEKLLARRNGPLSMVNVPPSTINNLFHNNTPHQSMPNKAALKPLTDVKNTRKGSEIMQIVNKNYSEGVIHTKSGQIGNVNSNFKYKAPISNKLPKEVNMQEEIARKRREALQKLQMKRAQIQSQTKLR